MKDMHNIGVAVQAKGLSVGSALWSRSVPGMLKEEPKEQCSWCRGEWEGGVEWDGCHTGKGGGAGGPDHMGPFEDLTLLQ